MARLLVRVGNLEIFATEPPAYAFLAVSFSRHKI